MANKQGIQVIADIDACKQNAKELRDIIKAVGVDIKSLPQITLQYKSAEGLTELKKAHEQLASLNQKNIELSKQLDDANKKVMDTEKKLAELRDKASKDRKKMTDEELRASLLQTKASQDKQKELKKEIELQEAANGSIEKARAMVNDLTLKRNKLNLETEQGRKKLAEYNAEIDKQNEFIKQNVDALAKQKINIGNYQGSAKIVVDALKEVEAKIDSLKTKQQQLTQVQNLNRPGSMGFDVNRYKQTEEEIKQVNSLLHTTQQEFDALNTITSNPRFLNVAGKMGDARAEVKGFTTTLIELEQKGLGQTSFADELRKRLAELTDQIADTKEEIKKLSSDSYAFDQINSSVQFLTSSYQTFVGVQALVGEQNEQVEETMKKLMAVQALANGMQQIAQQLTTRGTIVNKAFAFVQTQLAVATDASAAATARLNAAFKLSTIGLVIGAVALLITKLNDWFGTSKKVLDQEKAIADYNAKIANSIVEQKQSLDGLVEKLKDENTSLSEKKRIVKELQDTYPNYLGNLRIEKGEVVGLTEGYNKLVKAIELKARSQAAGELLAEQEKEFLKEGLKYGVTTWEQADKIYNKYKDTDNVITNVFLNAYENAKATHEELKGIKAEADKALNGLGGDPTGGQQQFKDREKKEDEAAKRAKELAERNMKAKFELYKLDKEQQLENLQAIADDEKATYTERVLAAIDYIHTKQKLIADIAAFEKKLNKATKDEAALIDQKAYYDQIKVAEEFEKKLNDIRERLRLNQKGPANTEVFTEAPESSIYKQIIKQMDEYQKKQDEIAAKDKQYHEERKARLKEFVAEVKETTYQFLVAPIEKQKNALQAAQDIKDKNFEKEKENITNSTLSEEQKAARLKVLEAENQTQKEQNARKIRELDEKKAKFDRAKNLADIIQNTATAIVKTLAAYPGPPGIILSALIGGIGIAQLARAASTQIPKYFRGRSKSDPYEGPAIVGDGGKPELIVREDGSMEVTPDQPTLTTVKKGDQIFPDAKEIMSFDEMQNNIVSSAFRTMMLSTANNDKIEKKLDQMKQENKDMLVWHAQQMKEVMRSKQPINIFVSDFKNSDYIRRSVKE